jgi:hypothetical protein
MAITMKKPKTRRLKVMVQEFEGAKYIGSAQFSVYGTDYKTAVKIVKAALVKEETK